jgi:hypothetical protein
MREVRQGKTSHWDPNFIKDNGDMAKSVDATDLIGLSLSMETC